MAHETARGVPPATVPGATIADLREAIEAAVRDEHRVLQALAADICAGVPAEHWAPECRDALRRALHPGTASAGEHWKAHALRRHLVGPEPSGVPEPPDTAPTVQEGRRAERVRSNLAGLVPLRALRPRARPSSE